jgi:uncharacterized membrane protein
MDLLDLPATPSRMRVAAEAAGAPPSSVQQALTLAAASPASRDWIQFLTGALLLLGAGLLLSGIVCFFAFNWADLGRFAKFAVLQAAVAICAGLGWWKLSNLSGRVALFAAAVLVGPLLGVYGQTYQTGADPWGLFFFWALLILPWVVVAHFTALWILTIALLDTALVLYWIQVREPWSFLFGTPEDDWLMVFLWFAAIHAVAVVAWEVQYRRVRPWLAEEWAPRLLVSTAFVALLVPAILLVVDYETYKSPATGLAVWVAAAAVFAYYTKVRGDLFMLTAAGGSIMTVLTFIAGRIIFVELKLEMFGGLLMSGLLIAEVVLGVAWLRYMIRRPPTDTLARGTPASPASAGPAPQSEVRK